MGDNRLTDELRAKRDECIRMHTVLNYGINAISYRIGKNKCTCRRWLIAAGVYSPGGRSRKAIVHEESRPARMIAESYRRDAAELRKTDECRHWLKHPAIKNYGAMKYYFRNHDKMKCQSRMSAKSRYPQMSLNERIKKLYRTRIWKALKKASGIKHLSTQSLIGCSIDDLRKHLEFRFSAGMNWGNYGKWHVDHIIPCASFDLTDKKSVEKCFHYSNLQPLWAADNISKSDNV